MNMQMLKVVVVGISALCCTGCGYSFQGGGSILPPEIKRVYIPVVENSSTESSLTALVTEALRDEFDRYGAITVVEESRQADAVLRARVIKVVRNTSTSTSRTDTSLQQDSVVQLAAELRKSNGEILWRNPNMRISRQFGTTRDVVNTSSVGYSSSSLGSDDLSKLSSREIARGQEEEAFSDLAEEAARRIYADAVAPDF
jgi:outer membrane lipopolysaccharide assembly protein LptE/RlpB